MTRSNVAVRIAAARENMLEGWSVGELLAGYGVVILLSMLVGWFVVRRLIRSRRAANIAAVLTVALVVGMLIWLEVSG